MGGIVFGNRKAFNELRVEIARLTGLLTTITDHEARLRRVERYMYTIPASVITSAIALIVTWVTHH